MYRDTTTPDCHPKRKKVVRNQTQTKGISHSSKSSCSNSSHTAEIQNSVLDVMTPHMHKDSNALQRSNNAKPAINWTLHKKCFTKKAQPHSQQKYKGKPKQAYQIIIPEQLNEQYKSADKSDDDDDFIIPYQMCVHPQKTVNCQKASKSYTKKCLYANIQYRLQPYHKHNNYLCTTGHLC